MNNSDLAEQVEEAVSLMELLDFNVFKINSFRKFAQEVETLDRPLSQWEEDEVRQRFSKSMAQVVLEYLEKETFSEFESLKEQIPDGVRHMLRINGIGPKKVKTLWKEAGIDSIKNLKEACLRGMVRHIKGFGEKIQATILEGIGFLESIDGCLLLHKADDLALLWEREWKKAGIQSAHRLGDLVTHPEVVRMMEFGFSTHEKQAVLHWASTADFVEGEVTESGPFHQRLRHKPSGCRVQFSFWKPAQADRVRFMRNTTPEHWQKAREVSAPLYTVWKEGNWKTEAELYQKSGRPFVPEELRTGSFEWAPDFEEKLGTLVTYPDIKGCLHNHSRYSDGRHTVKEMAQACMERGWSYFGIADHSQTAVYAQGLDEGRVETQWKEIEALNLEMTPFRILKGIESDILGDGSLDYPDDFIGKFDFVVASVHSGLRMDKESATRRLIRAIEHPATKILGHCSGRVLLRRAGYPLDYARILDACKANGVAIELNAHPARLDMDWRNLRLALEAGLMISINPDAHQQTEMDLMRYGVYMARKAGATAEQVLNTRTTEGVIQFFKTGK